MRDTEIMRTQFDNTVLLDLLAFQRELFQLVDPLLRLKASVARDGLIGGVLPPVGLFRPIFDAAALRIMNECDSAVQAITDRLAARYAKQNPLFGIMWEQHKLRLSTELSRGG